MSAYNWRVFRREKILCYVLVFDQVQIIKRCLDFIATHADRLEIVVIENPSPNTPEIGKYLRKLGGSGLIQRHYLLDENVTGTAYDVVINHEKKLIESRKFVMLTDGDITCDSPGWLAEETRVLKKHRDVFACGVTFDQVNLPTETFPEATEWIPPDKSVNADYFETYTGGHLLLFRSFELLNFLDWQQQNDKPFVDGVLHDYCTNVLHKKWARTKKAKAYHLTWDLYKDLNHPYTKLKLSQSFQATWYHGKKSGFRLNEY